MTDPIHLWVSEGFATMFGVYSEEPPRVQEVIRDMCAIINDPEDSDAKDAALVTLCEALFPTLPVV